MAILRGWNWWLKSGLVFRLLVATGLALLLSGALMLYFSVGNGAGAERKRLAETSAEQLDFLLPLLAEHAVVGDYSAIQQLLDKQVKRSNLRKIRWIDHKGNILSAQDGDEALLAPAWFAAWLAVPAPEVTRNVEVGGQDYGAVTLQATPIPGINHIWLDFMHQVSYLMLGLLATFSIIAGLVKWALEPLRTLEAGAKKFGRGDYSARIPEAGIPEMLCTIRAFNAMAENSAKLAASRIERETWLRESEEQLRQVTGSLGEGVYLVDHGWNISFINPEAERLLGWSAAEALGRNAHALFHHHAAPAGEMCHIRKANLAGETYRSGEESFIRSDGRIFPISLVSVPTFKGGAVTGSVVAFTDITERKEAEQALHESEERFRLIGTAANDGIIILGAEDRAVYWNPAAQALFGYSASEVLGRKMHELIAPARFREDFRRGFASFMACGEGTLLGKTTEFAGLHKNGQEIPVELSISTFQIKGQRHALGIVRDIAKRKRTEESLRKFARAVEQSANTVVITDIDGHIEYVNPKFTETTGYTPEEALGQNPRILKSGHTGDEEYRMLWETILSGQEWRGEFYNRRKDGSLYWEAAAVSPIRDEKGRITHFLAVKENITARKAAEEALQQLNQTLEQQVGEEVARNMEQERLLIQQARLAAMGEMIGNIAHQWRQPLNALGLLLGNLKDANDYHELDAAMINDQTAKGRQLVNKMSTTIDDFRNFFKPNKEKEDFSLADAIEKTLELIGHGLKNHSIAVQLTACDAIRVNGFPNEFSQVLLNVFNNAKDALLERNVSGGRIDVTLGGDGKTAWVAIRDNAGGIAKDILAKIFDPYFTTKEKGTGIGLYMSKMIMEHMNGSIVARNAGDGVEFRLELPLAPQSGSADSPSPV